jgi:hypothetical protein
LSADRTYTITPSASARAEQNFTATAGQTTFTITGGYVVGLVDVFINGARLLPTDYTATNGTTVVLGTGALLNDAVTVLNYTSTIAALPTSRDVIDYTATAAQTTFTVTGGYVVGLLDVYVNGSKLTSAEFTATNGTTFVLTEASVVGNQVQAIRYNASVTGISGSGTANYVPKFTASGTVGNSLIFDNGTNVGIGTASPSYKLDITGTARISSSLIVSGSISTPESINMGSPFMFRNKVINGAMTIDQRNNGSSITVDGFPLDRFVIYESGADFTMQRSTVAPAGFVNSLSVTVNTGVAMVAGNYTTIRHGIEGINTFDLAWGTASAKNITVSFWVRSSLTGNFGLALRNNANNYGYVASYNIPTANTWTYITLTIPAPTSGAWSTAAATRGIHLIWDLGVGTSYSIAAGSWTSASEILGLTGGTKLKATTGATFYLTGVQLEVGNVATPFEHRPISIEESLCKRYYEKIVFSGGSYFVAKVAGNQTYASVKYKTVKMSDPTVTLVSVSTASDSNGHTAVSNGVHEGSWYATLGGSLTNNVNGYTFTAECEI